jgi:hypothetical protein
LSGETDRSRHHHRTDLHETAGFCASFPPVELGTRLAEWITMLLVCVFSAATFAAGLVGPSLVLALANAVPQQSEPDSSPASAIEQALAERACAGVFGETAGNDTHGKCLGARLLTMRSDFGKDLNQLLPAERKKLDAACGRLLTTRGREGYLDCLHSQLASLPARKGRTSPPVPADEPVVEVLTSMVEIIDPPKTASSTVLSASFLSSYPLQSAGALLITIAASAGVVFFVKGRRAQHACRVCAVRVPAGDLCATCRHDAAEAVRHAAADRASQKRALEDDKRREDVQADEQRQLKVRTEEDARRRQLEEAHRREHEARLREEDQQEREDFDRRQAEASQLAQAAASDAAALDPFAVLGVARGSSDEAIRAAFEIAKLTYDPEEVSHLGIDAQERYAAKLRAAERAYQILVGDIDAPAAPASDERTTAEPSIGDLVTR